VIIRRKSVLNFSLRAKDSPAEKENGRIMSSEKEMKFFSTNITREDTLGMLRVYGAIKNGEAVPFEEIRKVSGFSEEIFSEKMRLCKEKKIVEISGHQQGVDQVEVKCRETEGKGFLGMSFENDHCSLTVLDAGGAVSRREKLPLEALRTMRGRVGELKALIKEVALKTTFKGVPLRLGGVVMGERMEGKEGKGRGIVSEGLSKLFKCDIIECERAVAAAYVEKQENPEAEGSGRMLYLHADSGEGVLIGEENISGSIAPGKGNESYLRRWDQFNAVKTAKELIKKGLGTDIVGIVKGDLDLISIYEIFQASENGDELANDLIKRSALALGIRAAYLVNLFDVDLIVLGGGIEKPGGMFKEYMEESFSRFLLNAKSGKVRITGAIDGEQVYSFGAALMCRREIFTEV
jgi:predicted NBD/HSP70 family sugar kinase